MKILVVRFSSIGDIVLTTPVVRCLKQQINHAEIHFITKRQNGIILTENPNVDKLFTFEKSINECINELRKEKYDCIVDLHKNVRSLGLKRKLGVKAYSFPKLNIRKWLLVRFKINLMPDKHIVERYFECVKPLNVFSDNLPCDYFISEVQKPDLAQFNLIAKSYVAFAIGAQFATKRLPVHKMIDILKLVDLPVVLLGSEADSKVAAEICRALPMSEITDLSGKLNLSESAYLVQQSRLILTHDTGLMHIATSFNIPVVSVWGNTVPEFGMYPYMPLTKNYSIHGVKDLPCRPCSKIGYQECPQKHFKCMNDQNSVEIATDIKNRFEEVVK